MLTAEQIDCIEMLVNSPKKITQAQIAKKLGVTPQTICNWKKNDEFISAYKAAIDSSIQSLAADAVKTQERLLKAKSEMVRYMVSKDILDRAGFKPEEKVEIEADLDLNISIDYGDDAE